MSEDKTDQKIRAITWRILILFGASFYAALAGMLWGAMH